MKSDPGIKASDLIVKLQSLISEYGDVEVLIEYDFGYGWGPIQDVKFLASFGSFRPEPAIVVATEKIDDEGQPVPPLTHEVQ